MKVKLVIATLFCAFVASVSFGQTRNEEKDSVRGRVIISDPYANVQPQTTPTPLKKKAVVIKGAEKEKAEQSGKDLKRTGEKRGKRVSALRRPLLYGEIQNKIREAKRRMRIKPLRISLNDGSQTTEIVRLAFYDWKDRRIDYVVLTKADFLSTDAQSLRRTENGKTVRIRTIRGNGVNTPVKIYDMYNKPQLPLIVQYPIEKRGKFVEMAYYVSTHPGIVTPETVNAGKIYVRSVLNTAREKLRQKGLFIQPKVIDIAERLALVEHIDHWRFRNEYHPNIYNDVYMLYAFNGRQTYRYSVSSAGAGGMVQMIPSTYRMVRSRYFSARLIPDFVRGMRNHVNAAQAMLLYMQMTWNDLSANSTIREAMQSGIATQEQLMAAGYNSNPSRLARYIRRGGENWTELIPRETRVYLQIYSSVEKHVPQRPRTR